MDPSQTPSWLKSLLSLQPDELRKAIESLRPDQIAEIERVLRWSSQPGPQTAAFRSKADILFYGGAAGGGKTDLLLGLAGSQQRRSVIFRRIFPSLTKIVDRSRELYGLATKSYNDQKHLWTFPDGSSVRFGALQYEHDVTDWQGQDHDLYGFDEITEFSEAQFRFVTGWNRTTHPGQRCRVVCTGNPPTDSDGEWVLKYWGAWLDENHPNPAKPEELRWYTTDAKGNDAECGPDDGGLSRTFIPALLSDNPILAATGYEKRLRALPEPMRSKMLYGDFRAGREDNAMQVIPSAWVIAAQARWKPDGGSKPMDALGVDVARGGKDKTTLAPRHGPWFGELLVYPGTSTPDGPAVAGLALAARKDGAKVHIDVIGVGSSAYDALRASIDDAVIPMNASERDPDARDKSGQLAFVNCRAEWWWALREGLDPSNGMELALPPDSELRADLCAPRWKLTVRGIQIEAKDEIIKRIGRSPDRGDALVYAHAIKTMPGAGVLEFYRAELERRNGKSVQPANRVATEHDMRGKRG